MHVFKSMFFLGMAVSALAQFDIGAPTPGATLTAGVPFVVEVDQPLSPGIAETVSVVIGLQRCGSAPCSNSTDDGILGEILLADAFKPQRHEPFKPPYQNYTLTIADTQSGFGTLHVTSFFLVGAGPAPEITTRNVSIVIHGSSSY